MGKIRNNASGKLKAADSNDADMSGAEDGSDENHENAEETSLVGGEVENSSKPLKKRKKGIIYVSNIPKHMNVTRIREILGQYGEIGRVYLQFEKMPESGNGKKNKRKRYAKHFTEGWVEFQSKRVAKQVAVMLNSKQISIRKRSQFYDYLWNIKYLSRFRWTHLSERLNYEKAVHKQRLMMEVSQAKKEAAFFQNNLDKSEMFRMFEKAKNKQA